MSNFELYVKGLIQGETLQQMAEQGFKVSYAEYKEIKNKTNKAFCMLIESGELF